MQIKLYVRIFALIMLHDNRIYTVPYEYHAHVNYFFGLSGYVVVVPAIIS